MESRVKEPETDKFLPHPSEDGTERMRDFGSQSRVYQKGRGTGRYFVNPFKVTKSSIDGILRGKPYAERSFPAAQFGKDKKPWHGTYSTATLI